MIRTTIRDSSLGNRFDVRLKNIFDNGLKNRFGKALVIWVGLISIGLILGAILNHWDLYLPCIFRELTGWKCPGCGVTRMSLAIMRWDFKAAFYYNPVVFLMLPVLFVVLASLSVSYVKTGTMAISKGLEKVIILMIVILLIFGVMRNII